jgi:CheY-like chemotaxis protein
MDVQMPVLDGLDATRRLRAQPATAKIPIITLTALAMPEDRIRCLEAGADAYLSKPLQLAELDRLISEQLNRG